MTPLEAVMKIKAMFEAAGAEFAPVVSAPAEAAPAEVAPAAAPVEAAKEYDLKAGGKVMIDKLEIGGMVTITDEAGNQAPAPAGEHELVDGTTINVDETGTITEISSAAEEATDNELPADPNAMPAEMSADDLKQITEKFAVGTPEQRLANLEIIAKALMQDRWGWKMIEDQNQATIDAAIQAYKTGFESQLSEQHAKFSKAISDLSDVIVGMINTPSANATENPKDKFNAHTESKEQKMKRFLELAKNISK